MKNIHNLTNRVKMTAFTVLTIAAFSTVGVKNQTFASIQDKESDNIGNSVYVNQQNENETILKKNLPEIIFHPNTVTNPAKVIEVLGNLEMKAEAVAIIIDGTPAVYLPNKEMAENVIKQIKLQYVSEKELEELESRLNQDNNDSLPPLEENQSRILDVTFSKKVSISTEKASPKNIFSIEQAVSLLKKGTLEEKKYKVKEGDVLGKIANDYGLKLQELLILNPELTAESILHIDQEINITAIKPFIDVIITREVNKKETIPYAQETVEDNTLLKGETKLQQEGKNGEKIKLAVITEQNGQAINEEVKQEQILLEPVSQITLKGTKVIPSRGEGKFSWPTSGGYVSSKMGIRNGRLHKGIDIARPGNLTIKAADNGTVVSAGWDGDYGNKIVINHNNGFQTVYAHLSSINVHTGQTVSKGTPIGVMGSTGDSTGTHLHFEIYKNGSLENPLSYIR
ncbi:M23 family metallopeptidase [Bacillaceae bacterium Marseille-Q3522]|nr:M23 family metallopeptidase [Bacillaceae bacterium Marseille-Q3522]